MGRSPKVSVVMSVYNGERYLQQAINSILNQSFCDFELIIVDDGSTDDTAAIVNSYRDPRIVRFRHATNQGLIASLNFGLTRARGELIARQDADDISLPNRLEEQVGLCDREPQVVIVGSGCHLIDETGTHLGIWRYPLSNTDVRWHMLFHCGFAHTSVMFRADALRRNRLQYEEQAKHAEDYDLWSRLLSYGQGQNTAQVLVKYRRHSHQVSSISAEQQKSVAARISESNLKRLGIHITSHDPWLVPQNAKVIKPTGRSIM
jgi:glycosyltransferase involved in cell wall biosynthesis